jgi:DNA polymerase-3 subunit alpha
MSGFVHLHLHSHYSVLDGVSKIPAIIAKAAADGQSAVALTDHGNMFGVMEFHKYAKSAGIKPIYGCEFYISPRGRYIKDKNEKNYFHLVLLAKDYDGYKNLMQLSSIGYQEGFYYKPRIDREVLAEHSRGLVAMSACLTGELPWYILNGHQSEFDEALEWYIDLFGKENFFLEIQNHGMPEELVAAKHLIEVSKQTGLRLVATNDAHYIEKDDEMLQQIVFAIRDKNLLSDPKRFKYANNEFYMKTGAEMSKLFAEVPESISNTLAVSEMCQFDLTPYLKKMHIPQYPLPENETADMMLNRLSHEGLVRRFGKEPSAEYKDRLEMELAMIEKMGFSNYFLIVADYVDFALRQGIGVGPGRGSAAGALVAYCMNITNIDPIRYGLFFERFLNPERVSMPDIDSDFQDDRRDEVKEYIRSTYGYGRTADIITFGMMKIRNALKDVGRVLDIPLDKVNGITKLIDDKDAIDNDTFDKILEKNPDKYPEIRNLRAKGEPIERQWVEYAIALDGTIRNVGTHASGMIISDEPLKDVVPLYKDQRNVDNVTQYEGEYLEANGLLKMDILGLGNLSLIKDCLSRIRKKYRKEIDIDSIPLDDPRVFELFTNGYTMGIFQFESDGMTEYLKQLRPNSIEDLIAMNALYRPGPIQFIPSYIARKHGREEVDCHHDTLETVLMPTYGIIVYQEQVMQIGQIMAGYSLGEADMVRRIMAKKKKEEIEKLRPGWIERSVARGYTAELAGKILDIMVPFSEYAFNKSHSAAYSVLAYQTAYLKTHYPVEFMASLLSQNMWKSDDIRNYCKECAARQIPVLPPDINDSEWTFADRGDSIRYGLGGVKGIGEAVADAILEERRLGGKFASADDFIRRMSGYGEFKKNTLEILVRCGGMDSVISGEDPFMEKAVLLNNIDCYISQILQEQKEKEIGQLGLFDNGDGGCDIHLNRKCKPLTLKEDFENELQTLGFYLTGKLFSSVIGKIGDITRYTHSLQSRLKQGTPVYLWGYISDIQIKTGARNSQYAIFNLETIGDSFRFFLFSEKYEQFKPFIQPTAFVCVRVVITQGNNGLQYDVASVRPIDDLTGARESFTQLHMYIENALTGNGFADKLDKLREIAREQSDRGQIKLVFHTFEENTPVTVTASDRYSTRYSRELIEHIKTLPNLKGYWMY